MVDIIYSLIFYLVVQCSLGICPLQSTTSYIIFHTMTFLEEYQLWRWSILKRWFKIQISNNWWTNYQANETIIDFFIKLPGEWFFQLVLGMGRWGWWHVKSNTNQQTLHITVSSKYCKVLLIGYNYIKEWLCKKYLTSRKYLIVSQRSISFSGTKCWSMAMDRPTPIDLSICIPVAKESKTMATIHSYINVLI